MYIDIVLIVHLFRENIPFFIWDWWEKLVRKEDARRGITSKWIKINVLVSISFPKENFKCLINALPFILFVYFLGFSYRVFINDSCSFIVYFLIVSVTCKKSKLLLLKVAMNAIKKAKEQKRLKLTDFGERLNFYLEIGSESRFTRGLVCNVTKMASSTNPYR